ncbi:hypothetical protein IGL98_000668 [Enterococcus sp. DIV0840]|uniref:InlB B-repeat-containing protein n=1 Tax=unclassified Enterococcus TaxID=2608891 RepID=UPI001A8DA327|nr:InlB B-repeat-containing protein [Enterococcus sp. DIV0849a]MBO0434600.1 InlB B-repeat-containing protein [Enterococcus sp. DIV0849a]
MRRKALLLSVVFSMLMAQVNPSIFFAEGTKKEEGATVDSTSTTSENTENIEQNTQTAPEESSSVVSESSTSTEQPTKTANPDGPNVIFEPNASDNVAFDGNDLSTTTSLSYNGQDIQKTAKVIAINTSFSPTATNKKVNIRLNSTLKLGSAPGLSYNNNTWIFRASSLPIQLQGLITNAYFVPAGEYNKVTGAGELVYEFSQGTTAATFDVLAKLNSTYSMTGPTAERTFADTIVINKSQTQAGIEQEDLLGKLNELTLTAGKGLRMTVIPGKYIINNYHSPGDTGSFKLGLLDYLGTLSNPVQESYIEEYTVTLVFDKKLGFENISEPKGMEAFEVLSVDNETSTTRTFVKVKFNKFTTSAPGTDSLTITVNYTIPEGTPVGSFTAINTVGDSGTVVDVLGETITQSTNLGYASSNKITIAENDEITSLKAGGFGTNTIGYVDQKEDGPIYLGALTFSNQTAHPINAQSFKLDFEDSSASVGVDVVKFASSMIVSNVIVTSTKGNTYTIDSVSGNVLNRSTIGMSDKDEYIKNVVFDMDQEFPVGYTPTNQYNNFAEISNNPITYYGEILSINEDRSYSATITTVETGLPFEDESASTATGTIILSQETPEVVFSSWSNLSERTLLSGQSFTADVRFSLHSYRASKNVVTKLKGTDLYLRNGDYLIVDPSTLKVTAGGVTYRPGDGKMVVTEVIDNTGNSAYKIELPEALLGNVDENGASYPQLALSYKFRTKNSTPTTSIKLNHLAFIRPHDKDFIVTSGGNAGDFVTSNEFDILGTEDLNEKLGSLSKSTALNIQVQREFIVSSAVSTEGGLWISHDYESNTGILNVGKESDIDYRLTVANNAGSEVEDYTALIPIPKAGEKTSLMPAKPEDFNADVHLQKEEFGFTTSLMEPVTTSGSVAYEYSYATTYETNKDSAKFVSWDEISDKNEIRMVKVTASENLPDGYTEDVMVSLKETDKDVKEHAGKANSYGARTYKQILGNAGYKPSEPSAIRLNKGIIKGQVFDDKNRNGLMDASESGRNDVTVNIYEAGTTNVVETTTTKKIDGVEGAYEFAVLDEKEHLDVTFVNPDTNDGLRFSPMTEDGSTAKESADHLSAVTSKVTPNKDNFDQISAGLMTPVTVTLDATTGSITEGEIKKYPGETINTKPEAVKEGYDFDNWYTEKTGGEKVTFPYTVGTKDETIYARYNLNEYDVIYHIKGDEVKDETEKLAYDELLTKPKDPTKSGFKFSGWYTAETGGKKWDFENDKMPASNLELYSRFSLQDYVVTFNNEGDESMTVNLPYQDLIEEPTEPVKKGYSFTGWYIAETGGSKWDFATDTVPARDLTLYARYTINQYTVEFDIDGIIEHSQTKNYQSFLDEPTEPKKVGHKFAGWYIRTEAGTRNNIKAQQEVKWDFKKDKLPDGNITLYAKFTKNTYVLSFESEGAIIGTQNVLYGDLATEPENPEKEGHSFTGWFTQVTGGDKWDFAIDTLADKDTTLYAQYTINQYNVSFDNQGDITTETLEYGSKLTEPTEKPVKAGYTFAGWKNLATGKIWDFQKDTTLGNDFTLTAEFSADDQTIDFDFNGGSSKGADHLTAPTDSQVDIDGVIQPTKSGYQFIGWFNGDEQVSGTISMPVGGMNLQARWTAAGQVIHFDSNGGTGVDSVVADTETTVDIDSKVTSRQGYSFLGWFDEKGIQVSGTYTVVAGGATFTAKWKAEDQIITFNLDGGKLDIPLEDIVAPTDTEVNLASVKSPNKEDHDFSGWIDEKGNKISKTIKMPAGGMTLTAKWGAKKVDPVVDPVVTPADEDKKDQRNIKNNEHKLPSTIGEKIAKKQTKGKLPNSGEQANLWVMFTGWTLLLGTFWILKSKKNKNRY